MIPIPPTLNLHERIVFVATLLSSVHRVMDGKPGRLWYAPPDKPDRPARKQFYSMTLPEEMNKTPVMFRAVSDPENNEWVTWLKRPENYRTAYTQFVELLAKWVKEHNGGLHGVQKSGVATRLWKTPNASSYQAGEREETPVPKRQRKIRDR